MNTTRQKSLHQTIVSSITARIQSGEWEPGFRIPFETELARDFGVSRMTVNKALTQLTREGLLERRRKLGTVVRPAVADTAILEIADIATEVASLGQSYRYVLLTQDMRDPVEDEFKRFPIRETAKVVAVRCLHCADGQPFCHEERMINVEAIPSVASADFHTEAPGPWLLRQVPWHSARHVITAGNATMTMASILSIKPGTACLVVERTTEFNGEHVTYVRFTYPGDRHRMVATFAPRPA